MFRNLDARLPGEGEGEDFARSNVAGIVGLGKLGDGEPIVRQADRGLGSRSAERRTSAKEKAQILGGFRLAMNSIRGAQQGAEADQGREFAPSGAQKPAGGLEPETRAAGPRRVVPL